MIDNRINNPLFARHCRRGRTWPSPSSLDKIVVVEARSRQEVPQMADISLVHRRIDDDIDARIVAGDAAMLRACGTKLSQYSERVSRTG